ncbi:MAG: DNA polymerase IV [Bacilli bacterium]|nr:DNA polymerase IV [Bacilli bacterium]
MSKVIVHIDLNAFFVRAEEIKEPSLENKPVAIGKEGRGGIVSTCSYEARKFGVHSGMPMFQAKQLCPNLIVLPGDYRFYRALSRTFFAFMRNYTPLVEIASVDECYADFTEVIKGKKDVESYFRRLQSDLFAKTGLKCSIGVGPNKFLAKMGSDYKKPLGLTIIRKKDVSTILYPLSLDKLYGVGKRTLPKLQAMGISTIGELAKRLFEDDSETLKVLGKFSITLTEWLKGNGDDEIIVEEFDPKSIGHSTTLKNDTNDFEDIKPIYRELCNEIAYQAKKEKKMGHTVQIVIKESDGNFTTHNKSVTLDRPINDANLIYKYATNLYEKYFLGITVRLVGVTLQNLISQKEAVIQMSLFNYEEHESENKTKLLINEINRGLDKPLLMRASDVKKEKKK